MGTTCCACSSGSSTSTSIGLDCNIDFTHCFIQVSTHSSSFALVFPSVPYTETIGFAIAISSLWFALRCFGSALIQKVIPLRGWHPVLTPISNLHSPLIERCMCTVVIGMVHCHITVIVLLSMALMSHTCSCRQPQPGFILRSGGTIYMISIIPINTVVTRACGSSVVHSSG